jgi:hypothetical protein
MGTLNLAGLLVEVRRFFSNRSDLTDAIITTNLNLAQEDIAKVWDWEELDNTLSGTLSITASEVDDKFLAIPVSTIKEIHSFRLITGDGRSRKLEQVSVRNFDLVIPEPEYYARRIPLKYCLHKNKVEFWPVPDEAYPYIIRTTNWPTAFAGDTGAFSDLDRKDLALVYRAASILNDTLGEYERAGRFYGIYRALINDDISEEQSMPDRDIKPPSEIRRSSSGTAPGNYWQNPFFKG